MQSDDVKVLFGKRVRQLGKAKGVSQEAFAHGIKIDRSYYGSRWAAYLYSRGRFQSFS